MTICSTWLSFYSTFRLIKENEGIEILERNALQPELPDLLDFPEKFQIWDLYPGSSSLTSRNSVYYSWIQNFLDASLSCTEVYDFLLSKSELLKLIYSNER